MRLVAVGAGDAGRVHPALQERAVDEHLAVDLAVSVVQRRVEQRGAVAVEQRLADRVPVAEWRAAGMTGSAHLGFGACGQRRHALGDALTVEELPLALATIMQEHREAPCRVGGVGTGLRPGDMAGARAVAGFAGDVQRGPGGMIAVALQVIAAHEVGRVAVGAHPVPVLIDPGPVQLVVMGDLLARVEVKPALAALLLWPGVPGERQRLEAAAGEGD